MLNKIKNSILDLFFPKACFNCGSTGDYLCQDCQATLGISGFHQKYSSQELSDLYFPLSYQSSLVQNLIQKLKYEPLVKDLSKVLSSLIIEHFQLIDNKPNFSSFILMPVPLERKRLKRRGFNQAEEIAKHLSEFLGLEVLNNILIKIKDTPPQAELLKSQRKENIKGAFLLKNKEAIKDKKILLVDDVYTTGSTMAECAKILKESGAQKVIGIVVARG